MTVVGLGPVIVLQCDREYRFALAVTVASIADHHESSTLTLAIAAIGFTTADRELIESVSGRHRIEWLHVDPSGLDDIPVGAGLHRAALTRFLLPEALPAGLSVALYLDVDLVVNGDLAELLATKLRPDDVAAAARDAYVDTFWAPKGPPLDLAPTDPLQPYFNAGVVLVDLDRWRGECVSKRCIELLRTRELRFIDQCAQNVVLAGRWLRLHPRWNLQSRHFASSGARLSDPAENEDLADAAASPMIIHYTGVKPWQTGCVHPEAAAWHATASRHGIIVPPAGTPREPRSRQSLRRRAAVSVDQIGGAARAVGLEVALRRHADLVVVRELLTQRTNGRVVDGPFRGTPLIAGPRPIGPDEIVDILGLTGAGPAGRSRLLGDRTLAERIHVGPGVPRVVSAGLAHCRPRAVMAPAGSGPPASWVGGVPTLVVGTLGRFDELGDLSHGTQEVWVLLGGDTTPYDLARVSSSLAADFRVDVVDDPLPQDHHWSLFRDLGPAAASRVRALLTVRRKWLLAIRRPVLDAAGPGGAP